MSARNIRHNQSGMASIVITLVTMLVITLIVLGFATITRREQGNTLDQQLSTQAFYAAETAVNDVRNVIQTTGGSPPAKTDCQSDPTGAPYPTEPVWLNGNHSVGYTCLLVNPAPATLQRTGVGDSPWVVPVTSTDGTAIASIQIQWKPDPTPVSGTPGGDCPTSLTFTPSSGWHCGYGLLRTDLVPTDGPSLGSGSSGLANDQLTGFFEALNTGVGSSLDYSQKGRANINAADCPSSPSAYGTCTATITGLSSSSYTLRLLSWYQSSDITITALDGGGHSLTLNGQVSIDATGVASGVLRRIEVRLPIDNYNGNIPEFAIQSNGSICKRFSTSPGTTPTSPDYFAIGSALPAAPATSDVNPPINPLCEQVNSVGSPGPGG